MVKIERTYPPPASLCPENGKPPTSYKKADVLEQLKKDFYGKCYLCNMGKVPDPQVEHLRAQTDDISLKFDWDNLFYSCSHCNLMKTKSDYKLILDCCKEDPEEFLVFSLKENDIFVESNSERQDILNTAKLLMAVYTNNDTPTRSIAIQVRLQMLQEEMNLFHRVLSKYRKNPQLPRHKKVLSELLHRKSQFAAFKRAFMRRHLKSYQELEEFLC